MRIERKGEVYGSFTLEISEELEAQIRKAAEEMVMSAKKRPQDIEAEVQKAIILYQNIVESLAHILLGIIGWAFYTPRRLSYVFETLKMCLEPLAVHIGRYTEIVLNAQEGAR